MIAPGQIAYEARFADHRHGVVLWENVPDQVKADWARVEAACAALLQADATARQRGLNLDDSVRRETAERGWKLVPVEPTPPMCAAGDDHQSEDGEPVAMTARSVWRAMLDAAPPAPPCEDVKAGGSVDFTSGRPNVVDTIAAEICGHPLIRRMGEDPMCELHGFVQETVEPHVARLIKQRDAARKTREIISAVRDTWKDVAFIEANAKRRAEACLAALSPSEVVHPLGATGDGEPACELCGDTGKIWDRVDGEITCFECGYSGSQPPPRDGGQATGAEPDGAALADSLRDSAETALMYLKTGFITCSRCGHEEETKILDAVYELEGALATLRTSAPPAQPSEAQDNLQRLSRGCERLIQRCGQIRQVTVDQDWLERLLEALQAATVAPPRETEPRLVEDRWRLIEEGKDYPGKGLVYRSGEIYSAQLQGFYGTHHEWMATGFNTLAPIIHNPTHWQPLPAAPGEPRPVERVRHVERGTEYEVIGEAGGLQEDEYGEHHEHKLSILRRVRDGQLRWMLPEKFRDGRFKTVEQTGSGDAEIERMVDRLAARAAQSIAEQPSLHERTNLMRDCREAGEVIIAIQADLARVTAENERLRQLASDYEEVLVDKRRLTRELDVAMHGADGAAKQASLCDLIEPARAMRARLTEAAAAGSDVAGLRAALQSVLTWADQRCPCRNEEPNPCPLCGASVENLEGCKSAENTLPRTLLTELRRALAASPDAGAGRTRGGMEGPT